MSTKPPQNHKKPTSTNPWDVPPVEPTGAPTENHIYLAVGRALSEWETLEEALGYLFVVLTFSYNHGAYNAYGAVVAHSTRHDMLVAAAEVYFLRQEGSLSDTKQLLSQISKLSGRRNDIAHGKCIAWGTDGSGGYYLYPPAYNTNKNMFLLKGDYKYRYNDKNINDFASSFDEYTWRVRKLTDSLVSSQKP